MTYNAGNDGNSLKKDVMAAGNHCSWPACSRLDFLPFPCDACGNVYCDTHKIYANHQCSKAYTKDRIVPACPMCSQLIPPKTGQTVDQAMNEHINAGCKAPVSEDPAYTNKCNYKNCKKREAIPLVCRKCRNNFCLKHKFEDDHKCSGMGNTVARAAEKRYTQVRNTTKQNKQPAKPQPKQPPDEDTAMAMAIAASLQDSRKSNNTTATATATTTTATTSTINQPHTPEDADLELALALSASATEQQQHRQQQQRQRWRQQKQQQQPESPSKEGCTLS